MERTNTEVAAIARAYLMQRIAVPIWARPYERQSDLSDTDTEQVEKHHSFLLAALQNAVSGYVNDDTLCFKDGETFPQQKILAGTYYIQEEQAEREDNAIVVSFSVRCLQTANEQRQEDDYLGFFVAFDFDPVTGNISLRSIDSAAI